MKRSMLLLTVLALLFCTLSFANAEKSETIYINPWSIKLTIKELKIQYTSLVMYADRRAAIAYAAIMDLKNNEITKKWADRIEFEKTCLGITNNRIEFFFTLEGEKEIISYAYVIGRNYASVLYQNAGEGRYFPHEKLKESLSNAHDKCFEYTNTPPSATGLYKIAKYDTGNWIAKNYIDKFGEKIIDMYITVDINGTFDTSSYKGNKLTGWWIIDKEDVQLVLNEYGDSRVSGPTGDRKPDYYEGEVKDAGGKIYKIKASCGGYYSTDRLTFDENSSKTLKDIFSKEGKVSIYLNLLDKSWERTYRFTMNDVSGFDLIWKYMFE